MATDNEQNALENRPVSTITIPTDVLDRLESRIARSEFETTDEYATFVLEEVLAHVEDATDEETVTSVDQEEVETRLEALGYLE